MAGGFLHDVLRHFGWVTRQEHETRIRDQQETIEKQRREIERKQVTLDRIADCLRDYRDSGSLYVSLPPDAGVKMLTQELVRLNMITHRLDQEIERGSIRDPKTGRFISQQQKRELLASVHDQQGSK